MSNAGANINEPWKACQNSVKQLRQSQLQLRDQMLRARESADAILGAVREVSSASNRAMEQTTNSFSNTRKLEENVKRAASQSTNSAVRIKEIEDALHSTAAQIQSLLEGIQSSLKENQKILFAAKQLSSLTGEIDQKVNGVVATSEQITLLALNAVIAANRAGRYGRAFSVVANQVQNLAEKSTESAEAIGLLASSIQGEVKGVLDSIENIHQNTSQQISKSKQLEKDLRTSEVETNNVEEGCRKLNAWIQDIQPLAEGLRRTAERSLGSGQELGRRIRQSLAALETQKECFETIQFSMEALDEASKTLLECNDNENWEGIRQQIFFAIDGICEMVSGVQHSAKDAVAGIHEITELATREVEQIRILLEDRKSVRKPIESLREEGELLRIKASQVQEHLKNNIFEGLQVLVRVMDEAVEGIAVALERIQGLRSQTRRIQKIAWEISMIIQETNLMAFNGSVEAVRAGQYGRSFDQVASDVRDLARESINAADRIQFVVQEIEDQLVSMVRMLEILATKSRKVADQSRSTVQQLQFVQHHFQGFQGEFRNLDQLVVELGQSISSTSGELEDMVLSLEVMAQCAGRARTGAREKIEAIEILETRLGGLRSAEEEIKTAK